ncbi:MAG: peptide chain release factor 1, partial [Candidatus Margulisbacteria bacterium]|nr:peptide chain release factor 1 [Candidatus Margulisiibacteriota bacterium]
MFEKLKEIENNYLDIEKQLSMPEVMADTNKFRELSKKYADLKDTIEKYREYKQYKKILEEATTIMVDQNADHELVEMAQAEAQDAEDKIKAIEEELKLLLLPKDPNDDKNALIEIRSATGGDEAALFAADLYEMYIRYAENQGWSIEIMDQSPGDLGGIKEISMIFRGNGAYGRMKYESGTHRVQRVPATEASGRLHTSAATVAVLPEAEDIDVEINQADLRIDTYRASGAGGQHVNKTDSAVRITHLPTGIAVASQNRRSQLQNREAAMTMLKSKLYEKMEEERLSKERETRRV